MTTSRDFQAFAHNNDDKSFCIVINGSAEWVPEYYDTYGDAMRAADDYVLEARQTVLEYGADSVNIVSVDVFVRALRLYVGSVSP